ncbi:hypothetical protein LJR030_003145 [Rhizobium sp. LjRoot30]|uniref:hypothetical protein n=1 Tax=Rhizobium sp. LjRoot30 TaxID=3342320 RepID=UPI003ECDF60C
MFTTEKTGRFSVPPAQDFNLPMTGPVPVARPVVPDLTPIAASGQVARNPLSSSVQVNTAPANTPRVPDLLAPTADQIVSTARGLYREQGNPFQAFGQGFTNARAIMDKAAQDERLLAQKTALEKEKLDREYRRQDLADQRAAEKHEWDRRRADVDLERDTLGMRKTQAEIDRLLNKEGDDLKPNEIAALANARADEIRSIQTEYGDFPDDAQREEMAGRIRSVNERYNKKLGYKLPTEKTATASSTENLVTATGPNGEKVVLRNGQWEPM